MNIESKISNVSSKKNEPPIEPSNELIGNLETGDILLFSLDTQKCCGCKFLTCLDWCIKCCTHSEYTHAALVIKNPTFTPVPLKGLILLIGSMLFSKEKSQNYTVKRPSFVPLSLRSFMCRWDYYLLLQIGLPYVHVICLRRHLASSF
jgi:hypothetical protein